MIREEGDATGTVYRDGPLDRQDGHHGADTDGGPGDGGLICPSPKPGREDDDPDDGQKEDDNKPEDPLAIVLPDGDPGFLGKGEVGPGGGTEKRDRDEDPGLLRATGGDHVRPFSNGKIKWPGSMRRWGNENTQDRPATLPHMGLGKTAKKIQVLAERAEQLYAQVGELREQLAEMRVKLDDTHESVTTVDHRTREHRVLLEALAEEQGLDPDAILAEASIVDAEEATEEAADEDTDPAGESAESTAESPPSDEGSNP